MKTIQQRLQSRISLRRNSIRAVESSIQSLRQQRTFVRKMLDGESNDFLDGLSEELYMQRELVKALADDQKLDKALKNLVTGVNVERRYYELTEL